MTLHEVGERTRESATSSLCPKSLRLDLRESSCPGARPARLVRYGGDHDYLALKHGRKQGVWELCEQEAADFDLEVRGPPRDRTSRLGHLPRTLEQLSATPLVPAVTFARLHADLDALPRKLSDRPARAQAGTERGAKAPATLCEGARRTHRGRACGSWAGCIESIRARRTMLSSGGSSRISRDKRLYCSRCLTFGSQRSCRPSRRPIACCRSLGPARSTHRA